ncbi:MAG: Ankyrin [Candidatus Solibacter sp.]|jgi:ankyrin repeat protein|nr:Ankyrin [Candidatus Solibacter sp.]
MRNELRLAAFALLVGLISVGVSAFGNTPEPSDQYYDCIRRNDLGMLQGLIKTAGVKQKDKHGTTPLHQAAANGSAEAMRLLVAAGAEIDAANDFGATPLMWAIGEPEKVRILVGAGANVNARSKMGRTPLCLAAANDGSSATVKLLLDRGAKLEDQALVAAAAANDMASIRLLLEKGAAVNAKDPVGFTPLMHAAANGNLKAVELLVARHADVNVVSAEKIDTAKNGPLAIGNLTALMVGAPTGGADLMKALLDAGAKVDAEDVRRMTPLMLAIATDHADPRTVRLLIERGADVNKKDREGQTAFDWAKKFNAPAILRELGLPHQRVEPSRVIIPTAILGKLDPKPAAARSVELLQRASGSFFKEGGCGSCHSANLTSMAVTAASAKHIAVNEEARGAELKGAQLAWAGFAQPLMQRGDPPVVDILLYAGLQLASERVLPGETTDAMVHNLAAQQRTAGNWHVGFVARPPMADGDFSRTAMGIRVLQLYGAPGRKAEFEKRIARAAAWLAAAPPKTTEDLDMQLLGLKWANAKRSAWEPGLQRLLRQQREDGGWAQTADLPTDAYATGQVLYVLHEVGVPANDSAYRRGVQYLLQTQQSDGSWLVKSRVAKFQPYFDTVFPYGPDQWISSAATAWSSMALSYATAPQQVAKR